MPKFVKGQSGNPNGRPPKPLTLILSEHLTEDKASELAIMVLDFTINGTVTLKNGEVIRATNPREWFEAVKWIYEHLGRKSISEPDNTITITVERESAPPLLLQKTGKNRLIPS